MRRFPALCIAALCTFGSTSRASADGAKQQVVLRAQPHSGAKYVDFTLSSISLASPSKPADPWSLVFFGQKGTDHFLCQLNADFNTLGALQDRLLASVEKYPLTIVCRYSDAALQAVIPVKPTSPYVIIPLGKGVGGVSLDVQIK